MLDDAVTYVAQDSRPAAERLVIHALEAASSLDAHASEVASSQSSTSRACGSFSWGGIGYSTK
jgi:hypothetical protein